MKQRFHTALFFAALSLCMLGHARSVRAQLLSNITVNQTVQETDPLNTIGQNNQNITATAPFQKTVTAGDSYGTITAAYSLTDNGNVATYNINCSGSETAAGYFIGEETSGNGTDLFSLTRPVYYNFTVTESGGPSSLDEVTFDVDAIVAKADVYDSSRTFSGLLLAGYFDLDENWGLSQGALNVPVAQSGSDSIALTFTAVTPIPEPSSAGSVGVAAIALLARRGFRRRLSKITSPKIISIPQFIQQRPMRRCPVERSLRDLA